MKVAILGFGKQGYSSYHYFKDSGAAITIHDADKDTKVPDGAASVLGEHYLENLGSYDVLVRSPGIHPNEIVAKNSLSILSKVTSNTNEFFKVCPTKHIIGVTGTKGKGTTTSLIAKLLEADKKTVHVGGNIGTPPLELLNQNIQENDWVVLELGNTQLIDLRYSPAIAVCLMIVPEHLDWHTDLQEYYDAKKNICSHQTPNDKVIFYSKNVVSTEIAETSIGAKIPFLQKPGARTEGDAIIINEQDIICPISAVSLKGAHNLQNVCAALTAAWDLIENKDTVEGVLKNYTGLPHRLEAIRKVNGITYVDDSFGTTPETAIVALEAYSEPKILILGGSDKGADYTELANTVKQNNVKKVVLIGAMANKIQQELTLVNFYDYVMGGDTMKEIIATCNKYAASGDVILLSTGCASFGMFKNYEDRGQQFSQVVQSLDSVA
jgi:UDP-N-acetylmuramoylalanine--D-glutamate ligase